MLVGTMAALAFRGFSNGINQRVNPMYGGSWRARPRWVAGAIVLLLLLSLAACGQDQAEPEPIRPVRVLEAVSTGGSRTRAFSGVTRAAMESSVSFRVAGKIVRRPIKVGDAVSAGQLIAELDRTDHELQVQQAAAALRQAEAAQRKASSDYERVRQLYENQNASRNDLDAARASFESTAAQVESAQKQLALANQRLSYTRLVAPVDCAVAAVEVEVGENVRIGQTVAVLTSEGNLEVEVAMPEILIAQIREGDRVEVTFDAIRGETYAAVVTEVGVQPTGTATTFPVKVSLDTTDPSIRPGMAAEVLFRFEAAGDGERIYVPPVAVAEDRQGRFVFVVEPAEPGFGVCRRRPVVVGELTTDGLAIEDGLADGDLVVTAGVSRIEDGLRVKLERMGTGG